MEVAHSDYNANSSPNPGISDGDKTFHPYNKNSGRSKNISGIAKNISAIWKQSFCDYTNRPLEG